MFEHFSRVWTPVLSSKQLARDKPRAVRVAGTNVVLFRDGEGRPRALLDKCPHRGVALSLGTVKDGCLACPFHGWELDGDGALRHVPWNPDAKRANVAVPAFPTYEAGGLVWLYTAPLAAGQRDVAPSAPAAADVFASDDLRVTATEVPFATHWTRVMENMLDWPHLPFVHRKSIGQSLVGLERARMDIHLEERPSGFHSTISVEGTPQPGALDFYFPNAMLLTIPIPNKTLLMMAVCVPVDDVSTRLLVVSARDFLRPAIFDWFFNRSNRPIVEEDRAIVESSWPAEIPPARDEASVRTDAPTLYFRKRYYAELRARAVTPEGHVALSRSTPRARSDMATVHGT